MTGFIFHVKGIVQGVGFRPFVKRLADKMKLSGWVINTSTGVEIAIASDIDTANNFAKELMDNLPPLAHVVSIAQEKAEMDFCDSFQIKSSLSNSGVTMVSPDIAICPQCQEEIMSDGLRKGYHFTNCTNCGPRYSITEKLPYDRPNTVMKNFKMCRECEKEYKDQTDRRFHAQPIACPHCGPQIYLNYKGSIIDNPKLALEKTAQEINRGEIAAIKGLGGYHLVCSATIDKPLEKLRLLKRRKEKPIAVMCRSIDILEKYTSLNEKYKNLINSPQAPIVIFPWENNPLSPLINPLSNKIGVMIAYTPLHFLLFDYLDTDFIAATSGNLRDEPIAKTPQEAETNLEIFTDIFLHHNRHIHSRLDDSVAAATKKGYTIIRRSRGFAPYPVIIKSNKNTQVFASGANLKNAIALYKDENAFLSQYIGDLDSAESFVFYEETFNNMKSLFNVTPQVAVTDIHHGYRSTEFAKTLNIPIFQVQHHSAHFASCLAENTHYDDAVGIVMDGFGIGTDGEGWGGEFFVKKGNIILRQSCLKKFAQPGMDSAAKHPARMLLSYLSESNLFEKALPLLKNRIGMDEKEALLIKTMCEKMINSIYTTAAGRLFEAVGSLVLGKKSNEYEGALAIALESTADEKETSSYKFTFENNIINPCGVFEEIIDDIEKKISPNVISARFHNGFAIIAAQVALHLAQSNNINHVALSGGVFQNITLLNKVTEILENAHLKVLTHTKVPANDGGIALGQLYFYLQNLKLVDKFA